MGFFKKLFGEGEKAATRDPWEATAWRSVIEQPLQQYFKELPEYAKGAGAEIRGLAEPAMGYFKEMLARGPEGMIGPEEREAMGGYRKLLGMTPEELMGGYSTEKQQAALQAAYGANAPRAIQSVLTQAGLGAPGIHHGRVREEAGRVAGSLYDELQRALAEENVRAAQLRQGALGTAGQMWATGAGGLAQVGDYSKRLQNLGAVSNYLLQLGLSPYQVEQSLMSPMFTYNPQMWQQQMYMKPGQEGWLGKIGGFMSGIGDLAGGIGSLFKPF